MNNSEISIDGVQLRRVLSFKRWLETNIKTEKSLINTFFLKYLYRLVETIENITSVDLFINYKSNSVPSVEVGKMQKMAKSLIDSGFISNYFIINRLPDEPKFNFIEAKFGSLINSSSAGTVKDENSAGVAGADLFAPEKAMIKCFGESIERTCIYHYREENLIFDSYKNLQRNALNPKDLSSFSKNQLLKEEFSKFRVNNDSVFGWVMGESLLTRKNILIPAQLVYLSYRKKYPRESIIRFPISTGASAHTSEKDAISKSICEIIEREAFMIYYLNELSPPILDLKNIDDAEFQKVYEMFKRHKLEFYILDISTDIPVATFAVLIIDKTGLGPEVVISTKTGFLIKETILGAIAEALKSWQGMRRSLDSNVKKKINENEITTLGERAYYWSQKQYSQKIDFFLRGKKKYIDLRNTDLSLVSNLEKVLEYFKKNNIETYCVDTTIKEARKIGFISKMALIPKLHPLYLNEKFPYLGGERLYNVPVKLGYLSKPKNEYELNKIPHPHI